MSPYLYVLSEIIFGLCGGYVTILSSSFAFGSHLAKTNGFNRSKAMAVLEGAIGIGSKPLFWDVSNLFAGFSGVIGFFSTSFIRSTGYLNAYLVMTGIHCLCIILVATLTDIRPSKDSRNERKKAFLSRLTYKFTVLILYFISPCFWPFLVVDWSLQSRRN